MNLGSNWFIGLRAGGMLCGLSLGKFYPDLVGVFHCLDRGLEIDRVGIVLALVEQGLEEIFLLKKKRIAIRILDERRPRHEFCQWK